MIASRVLYSQWAITIANQLFKLEKWNGLEPSYLTNRQLMANCMPPSPSHAATNSAHQIASAIDFMKENRFVKGMTIHYHPSRFPQSDRERLLKA